MSQPEPQISRPARLTAAVPPFLLSGWSASALLTAMDGVVKELSPRYSALHLTASALPRGRRRWAPCCSLRAPLPDRGVITGNLLRGVMVALSTFGFFYGLSVLPLARSSSSPSSRRCWSR